MCKIDIKRALDETFLNCLALTFCDVIGDVLPEWACHPSESDNIPSVNFDGYPVSKMRNTGPSD